MPEEGTSNAAKIRYKYPLSTIHVLEVHIKASLETQLVDRFALNATRAAQGMPTLVSNAKIALLDMNLQRHHMAMGIQVIIKDPKEIENIKEREMDITKEKNSKIFGCWGQRHPYDQGDRRPLHEVFRRGWCIRPMKRPKR